MLYNCNSENTKECIFHITKLYPRDSTLSVVSGHFLPVTDTCSFPINGKGRNDPTKDYLWCAIKSRANSQPSYHYPGMRIKFLRTLYHTHTNMYIYVSFSLKEYTTFISFCRNSIVLGQGCSSTDHRDVARRWIKHHMT